jgi:hypothetical protein
MFTESKTGRIERWSEALAAFDFDLEYRSSDKMKHVDALSRAPLPVLVTTRSQAHQDPKIAGQHHTGHSSHQSAQSTTMTEAPSDNRLDVVHEFQRIDPFTNAVIGFLTSDTLPTERKLRSSVCNAISQNTFVMHNGVLYKKDGDQRLLVVPKQLRHQVMMSAHTHRGRRKTLSLLRLRVWWPHMYAM